MNFVPVTVPAIEISIVSVVARVARVNVPAAGHYFPDALDECVHPVRPAHRRQGLIIYRVTRQVSNLGWVDSDLACSFILLGSR